MHAFSTFINNKSKLVDKLMRSADLCVNIPHLAEKILGFPQKEKSF